MSFKNALKKFNASMKKQGKRTYKKKNLLNWSKKDVVKAQKKARKKHSSSSSKKHSSSSSSSSSNPWKKTYQATKNNSQKKTDTEKKSIINKLGSNLATGLKKSLGFGKNDKPEALFKQGSTAQNAVDKLNSFSEEANRMQVPMALMGAVGVGSGFGKNGKWISSNVLKTGKVIENAGKSNLPKVGTLEGLADITQGTGNIAVNTKTTKQTLTMLGKIIASTKKNNKKPCGCCWCNINSFRLLSLGGTSKRR